MSTTPQETVTIPLTPPALPTPEPIRQRMLATGWRLILDLEEGKRKKKRNEVWARSRGSYLQSAEIDLASWRQPMVRGGIPTILEGLAILHGTAGEGV